MKKLTLFYSFAVTLANLTIILLLVSSCKKQDNSSKTKAIAGCNIPTGGYFIDRPPPKPSPDSEVTIIAGHGGIFSNTPQFEVPTDKVIWVRMPFGVSIETKIVKHWTQSGDFADPLQGLELVPKSKNLTEKAKEAGKRISEALALREQSRWIKYEAGTSIPNPLIGKEDMSDYKPINTSMKLLEPLTNVYQRGPALGAAQYLEDLVKRSSSKNIVIGSCLGCSTQKQQWLLRIKKK